MEISHEEAMKIAKEMEKKAEESTNRQIKELGISKLDKNLIKEIKKLLRDKLLIQKEIQIAFANNIKTDLQNRIYSLDKIDSEIKYYVNLGHIKKQNRTNMYLFWLTILVTILMTIQIFIMVIPYIRVTNE